MIILSSFNPIYSISSFKHKEFTDVGRFETKLKSKTKNNTHPIEKIRFLLHNPGREMGYNPNPHLFSLHINPYRYWINYNTH